MTTSHLQTLPTAVLVFFVANAAVAGDAKRDAQLQAAGAGAMTLKRSMKDPTSFTLTSLVAKPSGAACYEYRAKNGFGAILPGSAVLTRTGKLLVESRDKNVFVRAWNSECTDAGGDDITTMVKRLGIV